MSFSFGGLMIKKPKQLKDEDILRLLRNENYKYKEDISLQQATSRELGGIGITEIGDIIFVFGRDIPHSCSFHPDEPSKLNDRLLELSHQHEIICYTLNGVSETYAWALFKGGTLARARSVSGGVSLSDAGDNHTYEKGVEANEKGLFKLIENFAGFRLTDLMSKPVLARKYDQ
jgi:hypothetical protein